MLVYSALNICFPDQKQKELTLFELTLFCEIEKTKQNTRAMNNF